MLATRWTDPLQRAGDQAGAFRLLQRALRVLGVRTVGHGQARTQVEVRELRHPVDSIERGRHIATE
jgi:hypothetical protein